MISPSYPHPSLLEFSGNLVGCNGDIMEISWDFTGDLQVKMMGFKREKWDTPSQLQRKVMEIDMNMP